MNKSSEIPRLKIQPKQPEKIISSKIHSDTLEEFRSDCKALIPFADTRVSTLKNTEAEKNLLRIESIASALFNNRKDYNQILKVLEEEWRLFEPTEMLDGTVKQLLFGKKFDSSCTLNFARGLIRWNTNNEGICQHNIAEALLDSDGKKYNFKFIQHSPKFSSLVLICSGVFSGLSESEKTELKSFGIDKVCIQDEKQSKGEVFIPLSEIQIKTEGMSILNKGWIGMNIETLLLILFICFVLYILFFSKKEKQRK